LLSAASAAGGVQTTARLTAPPPLSSAPAHCVSVVSIENRTSTVLHYQLKWQGTAWQSFAVQPGKTELHWMNGSKQSASIRYDWSFKPGYQEQSYALPSL